MSRALVDGTFAGTDLHAVYRLQRSELGQHHILALAELPQLGPHATGLGKLIANLGLPFELRSYGWQLQRGDRITAADQLRAISHRNSMIQALADVAEDDAVDEVAVRLRGPVSLSVAGMLPSGQRILRDPGARHDMAASWADGVAGLVERIGDVLGARTTILVQEDEAADAVRGTIRSVSGADVERALEVTEVQTMWQQLAQLQDLDATVCIATDPDLWTTARADNSVLLDWPHGKSQQTETTWELVDSLLSAQTPVALHVPHHAQPQYFAEELVHQYRDWGLDPAGLEHVRFVRRFNQATQRTAGAGLEALRELAEHATGYATTG